MTLDYSSSPAPKRRGIGLFGWVLFIGLVIMLLLLLQQNRGNIAQVSFNEFKHLLETGKLGEIELSDNDVTATVPGGYTDSTNSQKRDRVHVALPTGLSGNWDFVQELMEHGNVHVNRNDSLLANLLLPLVPWILIFFFIWFFVFRQIRRQARPTV